MDRSFCTCLFKSTCKGVICEGVISDSDSSLQLYLVDQKGQQHSESVAILCHGQLPGS